MSYHDRAETVTTGRNRAFDAFVPGKSSIDFAPNSTGPECAIFTVHHESQLQFKCAYYILSVPAGMRHRRGTGRPLLRRNQAERQAQLVRFRPSAALGPRARVLGLLVRVRGRRAGARHPVAPSGSRVRGAAVRRARQPPRARARAAPRASARAQGRAGRRTTPRDRARRPTVSRGRAANRSRRRAAPRARARGPAVSRGRAAAVPGRDQPARALLRAHPGLRSRSVLRRRRPCLRVLRTRRHRLLIPVRARQRPS